MYLRNKHTLTYLRGAIKSIVSVVFKRGWSENCIVVSTESSGAGKGHLAVIEVKYKKKYSDFAKTFWN